MGNIHSTATIGARANIGADTEIGPYCVIDGDVEIGPQTIVESHVRIGSRFGRVRIGANNHIQHGAVLGGPPQDLGYLASEGTELVIGDHNRIGELVIGDHNRIGEFVSINLGTAKGGGVTRVGNHNFIMAYVHIGHDCRLADHIIVTNGAQFAGHITIEHHALVSGLVGVTQFCRLGAYSFLVAGAFANKDIAPFTIAEGHWATPRAANRVGLKRAGFDPGERRNIDAAVRILLDRTLTIDDVVAAVEARCAPSAQIAHFLQFLRTSERGVARG